MKMLGLLLLFVFSVLLGVYLANFQRQKVTNSKELLEAMKKVKILIGYSRTDKYKALKEIKYNYFCECNKLGKLDSKIFLIANNYFDEMGSRDYNSEIEALNCAIYEAESQLKRVIQNYNQNKKLYISSGVLAGTFIVIVLI